MHFWAAIRDPHHGVNIVNDSVWDAEDAHEISRDILDHRLYQHLFVGTRQELLFPSL